MLMLWPAELPWIGPSVAVVLSPVLLASSLIGGFLLIATLIGWPLMLAAIAYDDCDGFGALSRAYSQWTGRPWYFVWSWCVAACAGTIALLLADGFGQWTLHLASLVVQTSLGDTAAGQSASQSIQSMIRFLIQAYAISFFWTSATIVYALLRQSVDWMPLDHLAPDDDERPQRDPLPVVGMPAMETEQ